MRLSLRIRHAQAYFFATEHDQSAGERKSTLERKTNA